MIINHRTNNKDSKTKCVSINSNMITSYMENILNDSDNANNQQNKNKMKKIIPVMKNVIPITKNNDNNNDNNNNKKIHSSNKKYIDFGNLFDSNTKIKTFVSQNGNYLHLWNNIMIPDLIVKSTNNQITIENLFKTNNALSNKIAVSGNLNIFNLKSNIIYSGIIYCIDNQIHIKFGKPILPLFTEINAILQFNIYIFIKDSNNI